MKKDGIPVQMPSNPAPHIVSRLIEIGITETSGMGPAPLGWGEIDSWQRCTKVRLAPWEARIIRKLSIAYIAESRRAESENCPPPWHAVVTVPEMASEIRQLKSVLG